MARTPPLHDELSARLRHGQGVSRAEVARGGAILPHRGRTACREGVRRDGVPAEDCLECHLLDHLWRPLRLQRRGAYMVVFMFPYARFLVQLEGFLLFIAVYMIRAKSYSQYSDCISYTLTLVITVLFSVVLLKSTYSLY